jgi:UDP-3-O-[3-hydroxymyristoyl] glucosamine N-acyltransferase
MQFNATQIAGLLNGLIEGDADVTVSKLSKIEEGCSGSISFLSNSLYEQYLYNTSASVVIINKNFVLTAPVTATLIRVESAENAFAQLLESIIGFC